MVGILFFKEAYVRWRENENHSPSKMTIQHMLNVLWDGEAILDVMLINVKPPKLKRTRQWDGWESDPSLLKPPTSFLFSLSKPNPGTTTSGSRSPYLVRSMLSHDPVGSYNLVSVTALVSLISLPHLSLSLIWQIIRAYFICLFQCQVLIKAFF